MTAEIAVMNRIGVALAADSAVTIGLEANKIYTSADKIFQLACDAPVGVMLYGSADFTGLPWETIIKTYRELRRDKRHKTLNEYGSDFIRFLCRSGTLWPKERLDVSTQTIAYYFLHSVRESIRKRLDDEAEKRNGLKSEDIAGIVAAEIREWLKSAKTHEFIPAIGKSERDTVLARYGDDIVGIRDTLFGTLPFTAAAKRSLSNLVKEMLTRQWFAPVKSGIVIAGFGDDDYLPSLVGYEIDGAVLNRPRYKIIVTETVKGMSGASVLPFAQREMVDSFMQGIHKDLSKHMQETTKSLFKGTVSQIIDAVEGTDKNLGGKLRKAIGGGVDDLINKLFQDWTDRRKSFWQPVVQIASSLPKDELGAMAEALVNLTKFRRRVTNVRETVGGPIDTAIITKGDGFVWIRRKHYFPPDLNPRILARFQR